MRGSVLLAFLMLVVCASPVWSNICAVDAAPAATLLFPFVVYDYSVEPSMFTDPPVERANTVMTITNTSDQSQILRVCLWTDLGMEFLNFNVLLTGYDMVQFSTDDILGNGIVPVTLSAPHESNEGVVSRGPISEESVLNGGWVSGLMPAPQPTNTVGSRCDPSNPSYPGNYAGGIPVSVLALMEQYLKGSQVATQGHSDDCTRPFSGASGTVGWMTTRDVDDHSWMYVTVDVVESCNRDFPDEAGYFIPGTAGGNARYDNVLIGHVTWEFPPFIRTSSQAVHLEADTGLDMVATEGNFGFPVSFYARYANINDFISDFREPLPTSWALPFDFSSAGGISSVVAWKGSTFWTTNYDTDFDPYGLVPTTIVTSNCHPYTYYVWDDEENVTSALTGVKANQLPLAVQEVTVDHFDIVDVSGWILFVFPQSNYGGNAPPAPDFYQTWMGTFVDRGPSRAFMQANPVANANCFSDQVMPGLGIDYAYVDPASGTYAKSPCTVSAGCNGKRSLDDEHAEGDE